ncbi:MAG: hypothetical protein M1817_005142 [Caeruleum heppii]|nr:MAG: hypothetical protein M1817_005142 [Caeruleum heppii]
MGGGPSTDEHLLIVLPFDEPTEQIQRIQKKHPDIHITYRKLTYAVVPWKNDAIPPEVFNSATILATLSALPPNPADCPHLELVHFFSAGTDHVQQSPIYRDTDITLTTSTGIHGPQIAEWVVMTTMSHTHHMKTLLQWQKDKKWGSHRDLGGVRDMVGQRLGILGYGSIGRQVARVAQAMGMDVVAYTASPRSTPESKKDHGYIVPGTGDPDGLIPSAWYHGLSKSSLHHFLRQNIDILLISVPLTEETTHFLGKEEFDILGKSRNTFIANISRGQILHQEELIAALKKSPEEGGLRGAALDVTDPEPLPEESELWHMENVIVTPHASGVGTAYVDRAFQVLELNLTRKERGEKLINVVDRKRGY